MKVFSFNKFSYKIFLSFFLLFQDIFTGTSWNYFLIFFCANSSIFFNFFQKQNSLYFVVHRLSLFQGFFSLMKNFMDFSSLSGLNFIFGEFLARKNIKFLSRVSVGFFQKPAKLKIISYDKFNLKVDLLTVIFFRRYLEYFRRFKYNEYLNEAFADHSVSFPKSKQFLYLFHRKDFIKKLKWDFRKFLFFNKYKLYKSYFSLISYEKILDTDYLNYSPLSAFFLWSLHYDVLFNSFKLFLFNFFSNYYTFLLYRTILKSKNLYGLQRYNINNLNDFLVPLHLFNNNWLEFLLKYYMYFFKSIIYFQIKTDHVFLANVTSSILSKGKNLLNFKDFRLFYNILFVTVLSYMDSYFYKLLADVDLLIPKNTVSFYNSVLDLKLLRFSNILNFSSYFDIFKNINYFKKTLDYWLWTIFNYPYYKEFVYLLNQSEAFISRIDSFTFFKSVNFTESMLVDRFFFQNKIVQKNIFFFLKSYSFNLILRDFFCKLYFSTDSFLNLLSYNLILKAFIYIRFLLTLKTVLNQQNFNSLVEVQYFWASEKWAFDSLSYWSMASWDSPHFYKIFNN